MIILFFKNFSYQKTQLKWHYEKESLLNDPSQYGAELNSIFYGKVTNAGGKDKANLHLIQPRRWEPLRIQTTQLISSRNYDDNLLYRILESVPNRLSKHSETGEIDRQPRN